jgi:hypothetical protein
MTVAPKATLGLHAAGFDQRPERSIHWIFLALVTALAFLLRWHGHDTQGFWADEVESMKPLMKPGVDPVYILTRNFHGALHKALLVVWSVPFGTSDGAARMLSAVLGSLTVPIVYLTARRWLGERTGRLAAFLLAINPFHIWYSQEVRGYVLLMLLSVVSMAAFFRETRARSWSSAVGLGFSLWCACLSSFGAFFLMLTQGAFTLLMAWRRDYPIRRYVAIVLVVLVCLAPYLHTFGSSVEVEKLAVVGEVTDETRLRGSHTFSPLALAHTLYAYSVGVTLGPSINEMHRSLTLATFRPHLPLMAAAGLVFGWVGLRGLFGSRRRPELAGFLTLWLAMPIAASAALAIVNLKVYNVRYPSAGFLAWVLFLAVGIGAMRRSLRWVTLVLVVVLSGVSIYGMRTNTMYWRPDARSAAELVLREGRPGDRIIVYTIMEPFEYYYGWIGRGPCERKGVTHWHLEKPERFEKWYRETTAGAERVWLVRYRNWYIDRGDKVKRTLDARLRHEGSWSFVDLPVDLYAVPDSLPPDPRPN